MEALLSFDLVFRIRTERGATENTGGVRAKTVALVVSVPAFHVRRVACLLTGGPFVFRKLSRILLKS